MRRVDSFRYFRYSNSNPIVIIGTDLAFICVLKPYTINCIHIAKTLIFTHDIWPLRIIRDNPETAV